MQGRRRSSNSNQIDRFEVMTFDGERLVEVDA